MLKAAFGAGDVTIVLDGEEVTLRPSLKAAQGVSRLSGGILGAVEALSRFDLDVLVNVVALGLGKKPSEVEEAVWRTGVSELAPRAIEFATIIANGGRPVADGGSGDGNPRSK